MKYGEFQVKNIIFGAVCKLGDSNEVELRLKNFLGKDLGLELKLSRRLFKNTGEVFLKSLNSRRETNIYAGAGFKW